MTFEPDSFEILEEDAISNTLKSAEIAQHYNSAVDNALNPEVAGTLKEDTIKHFGGLLARSAQEIQKLDTNQNLAAGQTFPEEDIDRAYNMFAEAVESAEYRSEELEAKGTPGQSPLGYLSSEEYGRGQHAAESLVESAREIVGLEE
ncbi:hypothetical protein [Candidatus Nanohalococcus occultus]|uniref:hypothetical protein n=1 Tax=Candidatus Nanohalococcus occultus TaxID=2978047 RepID=UPI0039DF5078